MPSQAGKLPCVVFQCQSCRTILGDNVLPVRANEEFQFISFQGACSVKIGDTLMHESLYSEVPEACGRQSSFYQVSCACCGATIGRMIQKSQMPALDDVRGLITLNTAALCSHLLGSYDLSVTHTSSDDGPATTLLSRMQEEHARRNAGGSSAGTHLASSDGCAGASGDQPVAAVDATAAFMAMERMFGGAAGSAELHEKVQQLDVQMVEVQNLLLLFNERIAKLEAGPG